MTLRFATAAATALTLGLTGLVGGAEPAQAFGFDICKKVKTKIVNRTGEQVKIYDLDYHDYGSDLWRSEPVDDFYMPANEVRFITRNLEKVNQARTQIRIKYKKLDSDGEYRVKAKDWSSSSTCTKNKTYVVYLEN